MALAYFFYRSKTPLLPRPDTSAAASAVGLPRQSMLVGTFNVPLGHGSLI